MHPNTQAGVSGVIGKARECVVIGLGRWDEF